VVRSTQVKCRKRRDVRQAKKGPLVSDPEAAVRLEPKGKGPNGPWPGAGTQRFPAADAEPPAERHDLTRAVTSAERGKPVALPGGVGRSQDQPTGLRVQDEGASEGPPVMGGIGVATSPHGKPGQLPSGVDARERTANRRQAASQICRRDCNGPCWCGGHHRVLSGAGTVVVMSRWASRPVTSTACPHDALCHA